MWHAAATNRLEMLLKGTRSKARLVFNAVRGGKSIYREDVCPAGKTWPRRWLGTMGTRTLD